jgi:hypothetical protein
LTTPEIVLELLLAAGMHFSRTQLIFFSRKQRPVLFSRLPTVPDNRYFDNARFVTSGLETIWGQWEITIALGVAAENLSDKVAWGAMSSERTLFFG